MAEEKVINIDATNAIVGRMGTFVAKQALLGNKINIFNCEKAIFSGDPRLVREKYHHLMFRMGQPVRGPFFPKLPDRFVKRVIRGMIDHKRERGLLAFKRIMCYQGVPSEFASVQMVQVSKQLKDLPRWKYISVGDLCKSLGAKI